VNCSLHKHHNVQVRLVGTQEFSSLRNSLRAMKVECGRPMSPQGRGRPYPGGREQGPLNGPEWGAGVSRKPLCSIFPPLSLLPLFFGP